ncbi:MAG TPA: hypothetical protein VHX64_15285 [Caulobacteraceae bacterium]|nr:hypothetical protein [Caulobacteraceae bacterium]
MRNKVLATALAAFALSSIAAVPIVAAAYPSDKAITKADEKKNPTVADAAIAKAENKDAKHQARYAHKMAKRAHHKAKIAIKRAEKADKDAGTPPG